MCRSSPLQKGLIEVVVCMGGSWRLHNPLSGLGQRAPLFVFMRTELEEQKVFPMKAHLHHVKEHTGTTALNFSTDNCLFFMHGMEEQPGSIHRVQSGLRITADPLTQQTCPSPHHAGSGLTLPCWGPITSAREAAVFPNQK